MLRSRSARRNYTQIAVRTALESLEKRVQFDGAYHNLAGGAFMQDWANTGLITTSDDWSGVPSIIGYRGDDLVPGTGVNPQTILASGTEPGVVDVNANQTDPQFSTGGVNELEIANPVVSIQGSGTADAPFIVLHVNSTGVANVKVSYLLRDVDDSIDNATQAVALQYRIGATGDFINVPDGFVADASAGPSATLETPVTATLPAAAGNQAQLQIRVITSNAVGNDENIGVDNIKIEDAATSPGSIRFENTGYVVNEGGGTATITLTRVGGQFGAVSVRAQTIAGGSATAGSDYTVVDTIVNFADNQTTASFTVPITDDGEQEAAETVLLQISEPTGGATLVAPTSATLSIADNDTLPPTGLLLNEISVNPPLTDNPFEYVELRGSASQSLLRTYFVSLEGDSESALGAITMIQDLSAVTTGSNGLLMIKSPTGGFTPPAGTTVVTNATLDNAGGGLQNGSNSFLIIFSPLGLTAGQDLDTNNDGTLDLPQFATVVDGMAWLDGSNPADRVYSPAALTLTTGTNPPDAATRFVGNNTANSDQAWFFGDLEGTSDTLTYNQATLATTNPSGIPAGTVVLTPGAANFSGGGSLTATADFIFDAFPTPQTISIVFSGDVGSSLEAADFTLTNITTMQTIATGDISLSYNSGTSTASLTFPTLANMSLPDGNYTLTLPAASVTPALASDLSFSFFAFAGDANRDRIVDIGDFSTLASNFNASPRTFSQGDFDYNGIVDIGDFSILASKFNVTLPAPAGLPRGASLVSPFSSEKIENELDPVSAGLIA